MSATAHTTEIASAVKEIHSEVYARIGVEFDPINESYFVPEEADSFSSDGEADLSESEDIRFAQQFLSYQYSYVYPVFLPLANF
jgi:hypothetical protein